MVIKNCEDPFDSYEEFVDYISRGGELEFRYEGKDYSIVKTSEGIHVAEAYNEQSEVTYKHANEVGDYKINNKMLKQIIRLLEITVRLF